MMTRRFFAAKPLINTIPGNNLSMGLSLSPVVVPVDTTGLIRPEDCPACPPTECRPVFGSDDWAGASSSPLAWTGDSWDYDGDYGGCDACWRGIVPAGGWQAGFRPSSVSITIQVQDNQYSPGSYSATAMVEDALGDWHIYDSPIYTDISTPGTYVLTYALSLSNDISKIAIWAGLRDDGAGGTDGDRPFQITNIEFDICAM